MLSRQIFKQSPYSLQKTIPKERKKPSKRSLPRDYQDWEKWVMLSPRLSIIFRRKTTVLQQHNINASHGLYFVKRLKSYSTFFTVKKLSFTQVFVFHFLFRFDVEKECEKIDGDVDKNDPPAIINSGYPKIKTDVDAACNVFCIGSFICCVGIIKHTVFQVCFKSIQVCLCNMYGLPYNISRAVTTGEAPSGKSWKGQRQWSFQSKRLWRGSCILFQVGFFQWLIHYRKHLMPLKRILSFYLPFTISSKLPSFIIAVVRSACATVCVKRGLLYCPFYYRSISIIPTVAAYNNRAQAEINLSHWHNAMKDCQRVLEIQPGNMKGSFSRIVTQ